MTEQTRFIVIAALVDGNFLRLYKEDGSEYTIPQGDPRVKTILDICLAARNFDGTLRVEVDVSETNHYAEYEKKSGGLVKLFRVAKSKVAEFFGKTEEKAPEPIAPIVLGKVPGRGTPTMTAQVTRKAPTAEAQATKLASAVDEIITHAVPVSSPDFKAPEAMPEAKKYQTVPDTQQGDTIIAVVDGQVIAGVEKLKNQISHAALKDSKGFDAFMSRISKVIGKRRHSVEDLLKFLEKGDLPIADDGSIVAYKRLKTSGSKIVDVHSGKVFQDVGSFVHMDEAMVDHNRAQDCSHGLHIARRGYLKGFSGNVTVICKINPEDVIAVPQYDANKVRVCGYHIVAKLTTEQASKVCSDNPMTSGDEASQLLLGKILAGDHVGITEYVKITKNNGGGLVITPAEQMMAEVKAARNNPRKAEAIDPEGNVTVAPVDVKEVAAAVKVHKDKVAGVHKPSMKELAKSYADDILSLYTRVSTKELAATELLKLKKSSKKSWDSLGITPAMVDTIQKMAITPAKGAIFTNEKTVAKAEVKVAKAKAKPAFERKVRSYKGSKVAHVVVVDVVAPKAAPSRVVNDVELGQGTYKQRIRKLLDVGLTSVGVAVAIITLKKASKKGWSALGVTDAEVGQIMKLAGK